MMSLMRKTDMVDALDANSGMFGRGVKIFAAGTGIIFCTGAIFGALAAHSDEGGGPLSLAMFGILAGFAGAIIGLAFVITRLIRQQRADAQPLSGREKLNQRILLACGAMGGVIGVVLSVGAVADGDMAGLFSSAPLSPALAVPIAIFWGLVMPVISVFWHRKAIDEQEAAAYRDGALMAVYVFWYGAPVWWLLWRGGLVPAPHGEAIYMATIFTALIVWFWKKYR